MRIISLYPNFGNQGGAQDVLLQIATHFSDNGTIPVVLTGTELEKICDKYVGKAIFKKFSLKNLLELNNDETIFISHDRKYTSIMTFLNLFKKNKFKVMHIAHNLFFDKKLFSMFPKHIVAVSQAVKYNLISEYKVPENCIEVIYNGISDSDIIKSECNQTPYIKIIIPGRICAVKQQLKIAEKLKGKLNNYIRIFFAGKGEDEDKLQNLIKDDSHFEYIGHINLREQLDNYDYVMLYSIKEGLPLSLIEGAMLSKPLITNRLDPVLEVNKEGYNGIVVDGLDSLAVTLNNLSPRSSITYMKLSGNSRKIYEENFTESKMLREYSEYVKIHFGD